MAPVATALTLVLAALGTVEAKPLTPGRHANPSIANIISKTAKRSIHAMYARYYGSVHGLVSCIHRMQDMIVDTFSLNLLR